MISLMLLLEQVGEALAVAGAPGPAAQALARQAGMFLDQRWPRLSSSLLPRLAACHQALSQARVAPQPALPCARPAPARDPALLSPPSEFCEH